MAEFVSVPRIQFSRKYYVKHFHFFVLPKFYMKKNIVFCFLYKCALCFKFELITLCAYYFLFYVKY